MIYIRNGEAVSPLLLNRFGHSDMLGLSTARDLSISAIISGRYLVERVVKIQNIQGNIAFFGSRGAEQPTIGGTMFAITVLLPTGCNSKLSGSTT